MLNRNKSFFARLREKLFNYFVDLEIYDRIFPHHRGEKDFGYPFQSRKQMEQLTEKLDVAMVLKIIEGHISEMPEAYGKSFRYVLRRDLLLHLRKYEKLAQRRVQPRSIDPRSVATHA